MKKLVLIFGLMVIFSTTLAQTPRNRLYKISSASSESYVLGTMHMGIGINEFKTDITSLVKKSRVILPEIEMTIEQLKDYKTDPYKSLFETSPLPPQDNSDKGTVAKLIDLGFPGYIAKRLPDNACMSLQMLLMAKPGQPSLDFQVLEIGYQYSLKVIALDTMELRQKARKESDTAVGACSLRQILSSYSKEQILKSLDASLAESIAFYKSGAIEKEEVLNDPIVKTRNLAWISTIENEVEKGNAFISVGYAHLGGKSGILQLLVDRGFQITLIE